MEPKDRTFSEHEVAEVIALAVERQRAAERRAREGGPDTAGGGAVGLTLAEVEEVGRGAGIDPAHLRAAAAEVAAGGVPDEGADVAVVERWADAPLTDAAWEDVVARLRASPEPFAGDVIKIGTGDLDSEETIERLGRSYEWVRTTPALDVMTHVNVSPRGDRTRVRVEQEVVIPGGRPPTSATVYGAVAGLLVGGVALWAGAGVGLSLAVLAVVGLGVSLGVLPFAQKSEREMRRKERARLGELADALIPLVEAAAEQTGHRAGGGGVARPAPALDGALLDDAPPEAVDGGRRQRRARA
jgi:hypothetical protein